MLDKVSQDKYENYIDTQAEREVKLMKEEIQK
jgi:hypothetical protein